MNLNNNLGTIGHQEEITGATIVQNITLQFIMKKTEQDALESQKKTKQDVLEFQKAPTMLPVFHCQFRLRTNV